MKLAVRTPGCFLYPSLSSAWERELDWRGIRRFAQRADALGFDWLWVAEHVVQDSALVPTMGGRFFEGVTAAANLLGATERIGALTYVAVLPYHQPVVYAKALASADFLSGGRMTLGLGAGYMEREFEAVGVPVEERGRRSDEYLRAMLELWTSEKPSFAGEFVRFDDVVFEPKCVQQPHLPLLVGGDSRPALRRAARLGDGWLPWLTTRDEMPGCLAYLREQREAHGRSGPFQVLCLLADFPAEDRLDLSRFHVPREAEEARDMLGALREAGASGAIVHLPRTDSLEECLDWLESFAEDVAPGFRSAAGTAPA